ncbi:MAG: DUF6250 domain-containing protein [Tepidisphaeraceae bacterium]
MFAMFCIPSIVVLCMTGLAATLALAAPATQPSDAAAHEGKLLFADDFNRGLDQWHSELADGGTVAGNEKGLDIDVPGGCTVWFKPLLSGPVRIEYDATVLSAGGPNDRVSDLNCFWMARDTRSPADHFANRRTGEFHDYDQLQCYYVGQGGNSNTTTRFRRYIGEQGNRPLLPSHDLSDKADLLQPNVMYHIVLIADGSKIQYWRDGKCVFDYTDPHPYTAGWFGFRTVKNHMAIQRFRVYQLTSPSTKPAAQPIARPAAGH